MLAGAIASSSAGGTGLTSAVGSCFLRSAMAFCRLACSRAWALFLLVMIIKRWTGIVQHRYSKRRFLDTNSGTGHVLCSFTPNIHACELLIHVNP
jgi:hypothetical protein